MIRTRPVRRLLLLLLALAALLLAGCVPAWPGVGQSSVNSIPRAGGQYGGPSSNVTTGPDGALYLVQRDGMVRRAPGSPGTLSHIPLSGACQQVGRLILGPDGALWGTAVGCPTADILRITTSGAVRLYALTTRRIAAPSALTVGPDRNLWAAIGTTLYRLTPGGAVTAFPNVGGKITSLATGPDHALWFTLSNGLKGPNLGRLSVFGFQLFPTPTGPISPSTLVAGPDGAMWFGTLLGVYGKITTSGALTTYGLVNGAPLTFTDAVATPDAVWFAALNGTAVRIVPHVGATAYQLSPDQHSQPELINGITAARDGSVWLSSSVLDTQLYRVSTGGSLQSTVAVRGRNGALYVQHNMDGHWISLGGGLRSRPSVFALNGVDYYVVEGNDGHPYVRTDALSWQRMSSSVMCPMPVARVWNNLLMLACGASGLYSTELPGPGTLPTLTTGGRFNLAKPAGAVGAPALLDGSGTLLAWATSNNGAPGPTYTNLFGTWAPTALQCASPPTAQRSQSTIYLACVNGAHQLQYVTSLGGVLPWSGAHNVLFTTGVGSPGLIAIPDGSVSATLVSLNGSVSESRLSPLIGSWHAALGGVALPDVAAAGP
jgi:virginiamycin B lyase